MTQEFHISVTPVGQNRYLVRTEQVAPGVPLAEEQVVWDVEAWLAQARQLMNDPLLGLLQGTHIPASGGLSSIQHPEEFAADSPPLNLVELGQQLYSALFQGTLRDSWVTAQGIAQHRREALRLRLGLKGNRLLRLPWEVMYGTDVPIEKLRQGEYTSAPRPLATGIHLIFSRYQHGSRMVEYDLSFIEPHQPLRILMVVAAPTDQEQLKLYREVHQIQQELQTQPAVSEGATPLPDIQLTILNQPGREQLTQALEQGRYQVLHYAGHSDAGAAGGSLYLVNNRTGLTELLNGDDLAGLLVNNGVRLAVFNSCRGAYAAAGGSSVGAGLGQDRSLAEALVNRGVPAVLAMAEQIPDDVALNLTWLFYRNLRQGYPIDLSLNRARQGLISAYGSHQLYWALPVLYMHPDFDGYLIPGDRTHDNPADRLILMPTSQAALPILTGELVSPALTASMPPFDLEEDENFLTAEVTDDADWMDDLDEGEGYEDDALMIADMLHQLTPPAPAAQQKISGTTSGALSSDTTSGAIAGALSSGALSSGALSSGTTTSGVTSGITSADRYPPSATASTTSHTTANTTTQAESSQGNSREGGVQTLVPTSVASASPSAPQQPSTTPSRRPPRRSASGRQRLDRRVVLPVLGALGAAFLVFLGYQVFPRWLQQLNVNVPGSTEVESSQTGERPPLIDPNKSTEEVKAIAIEQFKQRHMDKAEAAVTVLLNRGAIAEAATALEGVPEIRQEDASIQFLQGRLAWQATKAGDANYSLEMARQHWEKAVQAQPDTMLYSQALGFAYYAEGNPEKAIQVWNIVFSMPEDQAPESLTTYAGIALALEQAAAKQPPEQQEKYRVNAAQLYQMVTAKDAESFQPQALEKNWLWTEAAVQSWRDLAERSL